MVASKNYLNGGDDAFDQTLMEIYENEALGLPHCVHNIISVCTILIAKY